MHGKRPRATLRATTWLVALAAGAAAAACQPRTAASGEAAAVVDAAREPGRHIAITIDDLPVVSRTRSDAAFQAAVTDGILAALAKHRVSAVGFVNERKLERDGAVDPARVDLLRRWLAAGQELGNHTYGHPDLHVVPTDSFLAEIRAGERVTRPLAESAGRTLRWFRHPFLHTGRDSAQRAEVEHFLAGLGYRVAPVTVDNYDYQFAAAFDRADARGDSAMAARMRAAYLEYMTSVVAYYEQQSTVLLGREIPHVLLIHANALNAGALDDLLAVLRGRGYDFVPLADAVADSAYASADRYFGRGGITWLHRWALTAGRRGAIFAGEPEVPAWVVEYGEGSP